MNSSADRQDLSETRVGSHFTVLLAILLSLATIIVGGLAWQTWRTAQAHRGAQERVLLDYSAFAAWSFASRVRASTFLAINPVFAGADGVPPQVAPVLDGMRRAADSVARSPYGLKARFIFLIDLRLPQNFTRVRDSSLTEPMIDTRAGEIRGKVIESLAKGVTSRVPGALPYRWAAGGTGDDAWIAFYTVRFRSSDDPGAVVGFETGVSSFASAILAPAFGASPLLPKSLIRSTPIDSILSVDVSPPGTAPFYRSSAAFVSPYVSTEALGDPDTTLVARVTMNPRAAPGLIIGGLPPSPLRTVLPLVSLAIVFLAIAFYMIRRREILSLELRARLSEARLGALRGQLQPHFLFNVLNSIAMLARKGDNKAVVESLTQLGDLLRRLLRDSPGERVRLSDELEFIERYLSLERIRFGDRLDARIESPPELGATLVPTLILQPLVENALRHGVGQVDRPGVVRISARRDGGSLVLEVSDNGPGANGDGIVEGIGLRNSRERLAQIYGGAASLDVSQSDANGFRAVVTLPVR